LSPFHSGKPSPHHSHLRAADMSVSPVAQPRPRCDLQAAQHIMTHTSYFVVWASVLEQHILTRKISRDQGEQEWKQMQHRIQPPHIWQATENSMFIEVRYKAVNTTGPVMRRFWWEVLETIWRCKKLQGRISRALGLSGSKGGGWLARFSAADWPTRFGLVRESLRRAHLGGEKQAEECK